MNNGRICVSVCAETADELIEQIKSAEDLADVIEIRFDCLDKSEFDCFDLKKLDSTLSKILNEDYSKPLLSTFRPKEQGGKYSITYKERINFWNMGYDSVWADLEEDVFENSLYWLYYPTILSHHDFTGVPDNLDKIYQKIKKTECADVIKIAVQTNHITDTIAVWELLEKAKSENKQIIPVAMGEAGKWMRILGLAYGAFMTYASLEAGNETAPGQVTAKDLIETYRVKELNEQTEIYGIVGNPVSQSLSPFMHNAAFKFHNLNAVYIPFEVKNLDEFIKRFVRRETREIELNFKGFSVTIPHKQAIIKHLDSVDETAQAIGAVNTVKIEDGKLYGYNTDAQGFIEPLKNSYGDLGNTKVAILGAGGAARACIYALKKEGAKVVIFARNLEKAESLADEFEVELREFQKTEDRNPKSNFNEFDILVNATPLGMKGEFESETPLFAEQMKNVRLVYDLIYNPFETRLIREARKANVPTIGGLAMLVAQGAAQFKIWTGENAPVSEISAAALRKIS